MGYFERKPPVLLSGLCSKTFCVPNSDVLVCLPSLCIRFTNFPLAPFWTLNLRCCCWVAQLCRTVCDPMDCSMPGLLVPHHLPEFVQVHVHSIRGRPAISSSDALFCFSPQIFPSIRDFYNEWVSYSHQMTKKTGVSAPASVLPISIQGWFPLRLTGLISLQSKKLSGVFSSTTLWKYQFFGTLPSLRSSCQNCMWPLGRP